MQEESRGDGGTREEGDKVVHGGSFDNAGGDDMCEFKVDDDRHVVGDNLRRRVSVVMAGEQASVTIPSGAEILLGAASLGGGLIGGAGGLPFILDFAKH